MDAMDAMKAEARLMGESMKAEALQLGKLAENEVSKAKLLMPEMRTLSTRESVEAEVKKQIEQARVFGVQLRSESIKIIKDPSFQTCTMSTAGGAVTLGTVGGAFGLATGVVVGAGAGIVPALLTFGLSIPAGAVVGGGVGLCAGTVVGGSTGGTAGFGAYKYRVEIHNGLIFVKTKALSGAELAKSKTTNSIVFVKNESVAAFSCVQKKTHDGLTMVKKRSADAADGVKAKSQEAFQLVTTTRAGITATGVAAGGALGGVAGASVGTIVGAALGVVPALFTFGLSIPIGAAVGLCAGTVTGGGVGAVSGGATAYSFTYRKEIGNGACKAWAGASATVQQAKVNARDKASAVTESVKALVHPSTGGSA